MLNAVLEVFLLVGEFVDEITAILIPKDIISYNVFLKPFTVTTRTWILYVAVVELIPIREQSQWAGGRKA